MGYLTTYNLETIPHTPQAILDLLEDSDGAQYSLNDLGNSEGSSRWYEHEEDLREFSKQYPDVLFKLKGEGEEQGDSWFKYFKNGKMQECNAKITYDEFNEGKLR